MELYYKNCLIVPYFSPADDGAAAKALLCLAGKLAGDYSVSVGFCLPGDVREKEWVSGFGGYKVFFIPRRGSEAVAGLKKVFADFRPDIVHTIYGGYDIPAAKASEGASVRLVWHSSALPDGSGGVLERARRRIGLLRHFGRYSKYAGRIVAVSKGVRDFLSGYCKDANKIVVVPMGVDTGRLHVSFSRPQSPFVFLAVADGAEGAAAILQAGGRMASSRHDFRIRLAGGAEVVAAAGSMFRQAPDWLDVVGEVDDYVPLYDSASCFVSAGRGGVPSDVIAGASISGLPMIVSSKEGAQWWKDSAPSVFMFRYPSSVDLAKQMEFVMGVDKDKLAQRCEVSSKANSARYSLDAWASHVVTIYRDLK